MSLMPLLAACSLGGSGPTTPEAKAVPFAATAKPHQHLTRKPAPLSKLNVNDALGGINGQAGIALLVNGRPVAAGSLQIGDAWSTSKVPVTIAALKRSMNSSNLAWAFNAITASDNASAQSLWETLGSGTAAASATDVVLRELADTTTRTNPFVTRSGYTAFGQTQWSLRNQALVASDLACMRGLAETKVFSLMGKIESSETWGLGMWSGAHFKGGWGPGNDGRYLVRQLGALPLKDGWVAVAIAVIPSSGRFSDGSVDLTRITTWLWQHRADLEPTVCGRGM
ncbi:MAG TPA: hypothetical protein VN108_10650 [Marmoricola sp.]|nr:hypothetical protein [Marmoricola sp.]